MAARACISPAAPVSPVRSASGNCSARSAHTAAGTSSNAEVRFLARRYGITDRRVWQLLKQEAELPDRALPDPGDAPRG